MTTVRPNETGEVEIDSIVDSESAYGDEVSSYTASITSSVYNFPFRNQRRYHAYREGQYLLPNDQQESDRLDIHHALMRKCLKDKLYLAPIGDNPQRALDLGTGTGIWAIDFADEHPGSEVIGNDLTPGPTEIPPNCSFYVDDIEDDWAYEKDPFDFIHARFLTGSIRDWPNLMKRAYTCTKPGGWVEFQDWDTLPYSLDNTLSKESQLYQWHAMTVAAREALGFSMRPGKDLEKWVRDAGFVNVSASKILIPLGSWPKDKDLKEIGIYNLLQLESGIEGITLGTLPHADPPWTKEMIDDYLKQMAIELRDRKVHLLYDFYVVYAQKPQDPTAST